MAKHVETFEHTADIGLVAWGDTLAELYAALGEGLADLVVPRKEVHSGYSHTLTVRSDDEQSMAVDFLGRLLSFMQTDRFCVHEVSVIVASPTHLEAVIRGEPFDPLRHEPGAEIKAVTYHMLDVSRHEGRWQGRVLLDL